MKNKLNNSRGTHTQLSLEEVLRLLFAPDHIPDMEEVEKYINDYPQYADDINDYAIAWFEVSTSPRDQEITSSDVNDVLNRALQKVEAHSTRQTSEALKSASSPAEQISEGKKTGALCATQNLAVKKARALRAGRNSEVNNADLFVAGQFVDMTLAGAPFTGRISQAYGEPYYAGQLVELNKAGAICAGHNSQIRGSNAYYAVEVKFTGPASSARDSSPQCDVILDLREEISGAGFTWNCFSRELQLDAVTLACLAQRKVAPQTIPSELVERIAHLLGRSVDCLETFFWSSPYEQGSFRVGDEVYEHGVDFQELIRIASPSNDTNDKQDYRLERVGD